MLPKEELLELFEETTEAASEEGETSSAEAFSSFMTSCLPPEILDELIEMTGGSEDFLQDVWNEKFGATLELAYSSGSSGEVCCAICEREVRGLTRHHVYPKETHGVMRKQGVPKNVLDSTISICRMCHSTVHRFFSNMELSKLYFSTERLLSHERFYKYAKWASKQADNRSKRVR